jgi:hypothetical protein
VPYLSPEHFVRLQLALGKTQEELGAMVGVSKRTSQRYAKGGMTVTPQQLFDFIRRAHPRAPELAAMLAAEVGGTPEGLGLVTPPADATPIPVSRIVDSVVLAAADAMELTPREARLGLVAAFTRAEELHLSVAVVAATLTASLQAPPGPAPRKTPGRQKGEKDAT